MYIFGAPIESTGPGMVSSLIRQNLRGLEEKNINEQRQFQS